VADTKAASYSIKDSNKQHFNIVEQASCHTPNIDDDVHGNTNRLYGDNRNDKYSTRTASAAGNGIRIRC